MPETNARKVASVARTTGPWGTGLAGYDMSGKLLIVVPTKPKSASRWMMRGVTKADRERVQREFAEAAEA